MGLSRKPAVTSLEPARSLRERARAPTEAELGGIAWLKVLDAPDHRLAVEHLRVAPAEAGEYVCRIGRAPTWWFGVIEGLLKMSNDSHAGTPITFTGIPPGAWFGEGTLLKREPYRYNIEALRPSTVAGLAIDTFHELLGRSIPFNRFVMNQLNERLGQFIGAREIDRQNDPDARVARSLAALFHRCSTRVWARCCASPSRNSATWSACRASA